MKSESGLKNMKRMKLTLGNMLTLNISSSEDPITMKNNCDRSILIPIEYLSFDSAQKFYITVTHNMYHCTHRLLMELREKEL